MYRHERTVDSDCLENARRSELRAIVERTRCRLGRLDGMVIQLRLNGATEQEITQELGPGRYAQAEQQFHILLMEKYHEDDFF